MTRSNLFPIPTSAIDVSISTLRNMKYSSVICAGTDLQDVSAFVERQLERHFEAWAAEVPDSQFSIRWIKGSLILGTNSYYLIDKWLTTGKQFLAYMLTEKPEIEESEEYPDLEWEDAA